MMIAVEVILQIEKKRKAKSIKNIVTEARAAKAEIKRKRIRKSILKR